MAVPKRLRYEVFRRDNYTCRYCGARTPDVKLVVDAVIPEALGGSHKDPANLVTACDPCNSGKTSSSPDAPLVTQVADDALRWSQAMQQAQAEALTDLKARKADRQQFAEWWDAWTYESYGELHTFPRPGDWEQTVDQLVTAGLPLPLLEDCIDRALRSAKVERDNRFRYMCGVAWKKLAEIQKTARDITSGGTSDATQTSALDPYEQGQLDFARRLLSEELSEEESAYYLAMADVSEYQDEPQTETEVACDAALSALNSARCNGDWLTDRVEKTLKALPGDLGERCLAEKDRSKDFGNPTARRLFQASDALYALEDLIRLPESVALMSALPEPERLEWIEFAHALCEHAKMSDDRWLVRAAACVQTYRDGQYYPVMCRCHGEFIPECPARGKYYVRVAELDCCKPDGPEDHKGHLVCEHHLEQMVGGSYTPTAVGAAVTLIDFTEAHPDPWGA